MATVYEYYKTDFSFLSGYLVECTLTATNDLGRTITFQKATIWDFNYNAKCIALYFPRDIGDGSLIHHILSQIDTLSDKANNVSVGRRTPAGTSLQIQRVNQDVFGIYKGPGERNQTSSRELCFTGRVFIYVEEPVPEDKWATIVKAARDRGILAVYRGPEYAMERNRLEKPRAFISHDARDQEAIARPIASRLRDMRCPVWYAEFSLTVGESLRESIEAGLKACHMCVLVLTPNFLAKGGWPKREYDSVFTRELVEARKLILPVWADVTQAEIFEYSPVLADRYALNWKSGEEEVCKQLYAKLSV